MVLVPLALWATFTLALLASRFGLVHLRLVAVVAAVLAAVVAGRAFARGWRPRVSAPVVAILAVQTVLLLVAAVGSPVGSRLYDLDMQLLLTGPGWLLWMETRARSTIGDARPFPNVTNEGWLLCGLAVLCVALALSFRVALQTPLVAHPEEVLYEMQARALAGGGASFAVSPDMVAAFRLPDVAYFQSTIVPQSAPGWPWALALVHRFGLEIWSIIALTVANVLLTAWIGRRMIGRTAGLLAAAFVAVNPLVARFGPASLGHSLALTLILLGTGALVAALHATSSRGQILGAFAAGTALGAAILVRPYSAGAIAVAAGLWVHSRIDPLRPMRSTSPAIALIGLLAVFGAMSLPSTSLGFPLRAGHALGPATIASTGTNLASLSFAANELLKATWFSFGAVGVFAWVAMLIMTGVRPRVRAFLPFVVLPALVLLFRQQHVRQYHEIVPFLGLAFGWSVVELYRKHRSLAVSVGALSLAGSLTSAVLLLAAVQRGDPLSAQLHERIQGERASRGPVLVFVPDDAPAGVLERVWSYNVDGIDGDVVVARETDPVTNARVLERFADRDALVIHTGSTGSWRLVDARSPGALRHAALRPEPAGTDPL